MKEKEVFELILKQFREGTLSHAFLLETNDTSRCLMDLLTVAKELICPHEYTPHCLRTDCNICHLISKQEFSDLIIVEAENNMIKKEKVINLKERFATIPYYGRHNIYIIKDAEFLNTSSSNSLLKFIEEPEPKIYGFLITSNKEALLPTILSRLESYQIFYDNPLKTDEKEEMENIATDFWLKLNTLNLESMLIYKTSVIGKLNSKEKIACFLRTILEKQLSELDLNNPNFKLVVKKLKIIDNILRKSNYNVNLELFFDKLIIEMVNENE